MSIGTSRAKSITKFKKKKKRTPLTNSNIFNFPNQSTSPQQSKPLLPRISIKKSPRGIPYSKSCHVNPPTKTPNFFKIPLSSLSCPTPPPKEPLVIAHLVLSDGN